MARLIVKGTRKSVMMKRRKGFLALFIPWMKRFGAALAVCVLLLWLGAWLVLSGTASRSKDWLDNKVLEVTADMGFTIKNIYVEGRKNIDSETLLAFLNIQKGDPLFSFDPAAAQEQIERMSWVEHVRIERRWPDTIAISLKERTPLALWQEDKKIRLLDLEGRVIETDEPEKFAGLPVVIGADAPAHAAELLESLRAEPLLFQRVQYSRRLGERRWDLVLEKGPLVRLPEKDMQLALRRLAKAEEESAILEKDLESIDLREEGRMVVKTKPGTLMNYEASFKPSKGQSSI